MKKVEADAAEAAAAEAAQEGTSVYPSSVTKAIAGLATPSLPSPSMFPEDWRMVEELLHDGQVIYSWHCCKPYVHMPSHTNVPFHSSCPGEQSKLQPALKIRQRSLSCRAMKHSHSHCAQPSCLPTLILSRKALMSSIWLQSFPQLVCLLPPHSIQPRCQRLNVYAPGDMHWPCRTAMQYGQCKWLVVPTYLKIHCTTYCLCLTGPQSTSAPYTDDQAGLCQGGQMDADFTLAEGAQVRGTVA